MRLIHCTGKLLSNLNEGKHAYPPGHEMVEGVGHWNAHLVSINRKKCIMFTNVKTIYTIFLFDLSKRDFQNLPWLLLGELFKWLKRDGFLTDDLKRKITEEYAETYIATTNNDKRVIGYMNDHFQTIKYYHDGFKAAGLENWMEIIWRINHDPLGPKLEHKPAAARMEALLESY